MDCLASALSELSILSVDGDDMFCLCCESSTCSRCCSVWPSSVAVATMKCGFALFGWDHLSSLVSSFLSAVPSVMSGLPFDPSENAQVEPMEYHSTLDIATLEMINLFGNISLDDDIPLENSMAPASEGVSFSRSLVAGFAAQPANTVETPSGALVFVPPGAKNAAASGESVSSAASAPSFVFGASVDPVVPFVFGDSVASLASVSSVAAAVSAPVSSVSFACCGNPAPAVVSGGSSVSKSCISKEIHSDEGKIESVFKQIIFRCIDILLLIVEYIDLLAEEIDKILDRDFDF